MPDEAENLGAPRCPNLECGHVEEVTVQPVGKISVYKCPECLKLYMVTRKRPHYTTKESALDAEDLG